MKYSEYYIESLKKEVMLTYELMSAHEKKWSVPKLLDKIGHKGQYLPFVESIDKLIVMKAIDFDVDMPLEELMKLIQ